MEEIVEIIRRVQNGDSDAYRLIVNRFQDMVYGYAYAILNDFHLAQDAAQEAFIDAYQCLPNLREPFAFPAWLKRIVHKQCDRIIRSKHIDMIPLHTFTYVESSLPGPVEVFEQHELAREIKGVINELPVEQRMVTTLFYIKGYSQKEISDFLEVPVKTVKSRLYASRNRLRERMIDMFQDELKTNALSSDFTNEAVEQAILKAKGLNKEQKYDEAETLLQQILAQIPGNPGALKELNRALMHGQVYGQSRWDILPKLAEQGRTILQEMDDEYVCHELARTLLAIPAMLEAVTFIEEWIAKKGPNMERLGMLAWAKGCMADYSGADELWNSVLAATQNAQPNEILFHIPFIAYTLVDCFSGVGEMQRAQNVAQTAWDVCKDLGITSLEIAEQLRLDRGFPADVGWLMIFHKAELDISEIVNFLITRHGASTEPHEQAKTICIRAWVDDPDIVVADWLSWVKDRIAGGECRMVNMQSFPIRDGLRLQGDWHHPYRLSESTRELLSQSDSPDCVQNRSLWEWMHLNPNEAMLAGDWMSAEQITRKRIDKYGIRDAGWYAMRISTHTGTATWPEIMRVVEENGIEGVDSYGMWGWYTVAREAAASGNQVEAFDALRKALSYWMNPPYWASDIWEKDPYWGILRDHPEFKGAFDERCRHIGPVYGLLHYFPGW